MNLGKLLAAGKSVKSGRATVAYRENRQVYLPKFVSPKNPFNMAGKIEAAEKVEAASVVQPVVKAAAAKTQKIPTFKAGPARAANWAEKFNPISILRGHPAEMKNVPQPVQAELSLERIKVVHNDLTDADVEVVPIKSRSAPQIPEGDFQTAAGAGEDKNFWSRLDEKFFGANAA